MTRNTMRILVIGSAGYIGRRLILDLDSRYEITGMDIGLFGEHQGMITLDYIDVQSDFLRNFDAIVVLAGHSSVRMCDGNPLGVLQNNVMNMVQLVSKLDDNQTLVYASSGSVYGNCQRDKADESAPFDLPYNMYDMSKQMIDSYMIASQRIATRRVFGLRFGTVNGYSPYLRNDVMLNAMAYSAWKDGVVNLYSSDTRRSILGISDLTRAIESILSSQKPTGGIYNLASFTSTSGELAKKASLKFNVPINHLSPAEGKIIGGNEKFVSSKYDFSLDCGRFSADFDFSFNDTPDSILNELEMNRSQMQMGNRNSAFDYERIPR